ncbi:serine/threonine-protein kinase [Nocardioides nitrophenolicus]|uniref:serine/threonine-protein kinase n=1 Tax=Nocardioides nitrophenolicus TaxID=60489 RepID=UPI00195A5DB1|nr:serine/threonine-protein kinase [Nocardioides nitrophenolicus]MBM7516713.1 hypothetical protein [Nocardioides nitrophenolicus]
MAARLGPGATLGRYRIDRELGRGGMGVVFAATDLRLGRTVALKVITGPHASDAAFLHRFHAEATVLSSLASPHVIDIHDHDEIDGTPFIVTQYVDGPDLAQWLAVRSPLPADQALRLCAQVARGLSDAHRAGVIHRDVKPANVLLRDPGTPDEHVYLCDFGIARGDTGGLTATGAIAGTWAYLAPERTRGEAATVRSDLYALGCVLWACLTGAPPYSGSDVQMAIAHSQAPVRQLPGTSPFAVELNGLLARLMAKDPQDRPADAALARAEIEQLAAGAPHDVLAPPPPPTVAPGTGPAVAPTQPPPPPPPSPAPTSRRRRWPVVVAALTALAVGGGAVAWTVLRSEEDPAPGPGARTTTVRGDLDGDGYGDVVVHEPASDGANGVVWAVRSNGGAFVTPEPVPAEPGDPHLADVDGDGVPEQAWVYRAGAEDDLHLRIVGDEGRIDQATVAIPEELAGFSGSRYFADVDGDGDDDLVLDGATDAGSVVAVAPADDGGFGELTRWHDGLGVDSQIVAFGDFDDDGDDDAAVLLLTEGAPDAEHLTRNLVLLRADDDHFTDGPPLALPALTWNDAAWLAGDVDGTGADELVAVQGVGGQAGVATLDGDGFTQLRTAWAGNVSAEEWNRRIAEGPALPPDRYLLSDVDGDGDGDLVRFEGDYGDRLGVLLNDAGRFADPVPWGELPCRLCEELPRMVD